MAKIHNTMDNPIYPYPTSITENERSKIKGHKAAVLWFTGLSGSGKSTLANRVEQILCLEFNSHTYLLDGDIIREGLNRDLGFSEKDRTENIRRVGEVCRLFTDAGLIILTAFISPFREDRDRVRNVLPEEKFFEIYVDCPLSVCEQRDPKGLYKRIRSGQIVEFTGITSPYEEPLNPELILKTAVVDLETCARRIVDMLLNSRIISTL